MIPTLTELDNRINSLNAEVRQLKKDHNEYLDEVLLVDDVMRILRVNHRGTVYKAIHQDGLPMKKKAGEYRIRRARLLAWMDGKSTNN